MNARINTRRVLGAALVVVLAAAAWGLWSARMSVKSEVPTKAAEPFVQLAGAGQEATARLLQERAELLDPTPLFLPTSRNAGQAGLPRQLIARPGQIFTDFAPRLGVGGADLPNYGADVAGAPESVAEVMARSNEVPFAGLGERADAVAKLASRTAFCEVKDLRGRGLINESVVLPRAPRGDFLPMEFMATISATGLMGELMLVASSGAEEVDSFFRDNLAKAARLGERLPPGTYRVQVGP